MWMFYYYYNYGKIGKQGDSFYLKNSFWYVHKPFELDHPLRIQTPVWIVLSNRKKKNKSILINQPFEHNIFKLREFRIHR